MSEITAGHRHDFLTIGQAGIGNGVYFLIVSRLDQWLVEIGRDAEEHRLIAVQNRDRRPFPCWRIFIGFSRSSLMLAVIRGQRASSS